MRFKKHYTTKGLYIGKPEAEGETTQSGLNLLDFFEDYTHIEENIQRGYFIVSGRKGSGKSAYAMWLYEKAKGNDELYTSIIRKNEFDIEAIIQAIPEKDLKFEAFFEWLILVRLVKMILETGQGTYLRQIKSLQDFYSKNSGYINIDKYVITEIVANKEVNFSPLKRDFGFISKVFGNKSIKAPFYQMIEPLRQIITEVLQMEIFKNIFFYVMFDDLDVKFKLTNPQDQIQLMDLIRISRRYTTEYFNGLNAKVIIFIRDDIADRLDGVDCDKNKIFESYDYRINWYEHIIAKGNESQLLLRRFINRRLSKGFDRLNIPYYQEDPWLSFIDESNNDKTTQFKYILDYTFYLPRDLMLIFKNIENKDLRLPLSHTDVNLLLKEYSKRKVGEIRDELVAIYDKTSIDKIFDVLRDINNGWDVEYKTVLNIIIKYGLPTQTFNTLVDYNLLIPVEKETGHLYFNYREKELDGEWEQYTYRTPKVLSKYFQTR
jgi:hypothetical protein